MEFLNRIVEWAKHNKLATAIIAVLLLVILSGGGSGITSQYTGGTPSTGDASKYSTGLGSAEDTGASEATSDTAAASGKMVVTETKMSLVVKNVQQTADTILAYAETEGGYMVSSSISQGEESAAGTVVVRVPSAKLKTVTEYLRTLATKVSSESLSGTDVTTTYADYETRIKTLEDTIARLEAVLEKATKVTDMITITNQIVALEEDIDVYKGYMKSIADSAAYSKITAYLATDELSLPYEPPTGFRPAVVYKQAVRAVLTDVYAITTKLIWIGVYGVFWLPALLIVLIAFVIIRHKMRRQKAA